MKKIRLSIRLKLIFAFGIIILLYSGIYFYSRIQLGASQQITTRISTVFRPTISVLTDFNLAVNKSKGQTITWSKESSSSDPDKIALREFLNNGGIDSLISRVTTVQEKWTDQAFTKKIDTAIFMLRQLDTLEREVMGQLQGFDDYENVMVVISIANYVDNVTNKADELSGYLQKVLFDIRQQSEHEEAEMLASFDALISTSTILAIVLVIIAAGMGVYLYLTIVNPVNEVKNVLGKLSKGRLPKLAIQTRNDEVGDMVFAVSSLTDGLKKTSEFAQKIGEGELNASFKPLSKGDVLGNSLLSMRESLVQAKKDADLRQVDDDRRSWSAVGAAKFADLLRNNNDKSIEELGDEIISNLVKYIGANQGSIFIVNSEGEVPHLEQVACYAWDRKRYEEKQILLGEGLTGRCWQEADQIYVDDIPQDYVRITSGLGSANPTSLFITPMKMDDQVYGVIELASLYVIEEYQQEFVESLGNSIATTIANTKNNIRTNRLLMESQEMSEQLRAQEEEMRQNMEELQATQEEMERRSQEMEDEIIRLRAKGNQ